MWQVEEVLQLRRGESWRASGLQVFPEESLPLQGVAGPALDVTLVLERWGPWDANADRRALERTLLRRGELCQREGCSMCTAQATGEPD